MNPTDLKDLLFRDRGKAILDFLYTTRGKKILVVALIVIAFAIGHYWPSSDAPNPSATQTGVSVADQHDHDADKPAKDAKKPALWTCAMHPQIKLPHPGKCPICYMDLIPLESGRGTSDLSLVQYSMSEAAKKRAEVETAEAKRERAKITVRMVGMVVEAEPRVAALTSRVDGRLDEIYISFTGEHVSKGQPMVKIWSPTLIKSEVELFETLRGGEGNDPSMIKGSEEKLIQYGVTQEQIDEIKRNKKPDLYITLRAPINGIVTKKLVSLGQFVKEGQEMYMINDLSQVWVKMDAYESDLPWIRYGQDVKFTTPASPGRTFSGKVLFVDPMLDTRTRTVKLRVEADNPDLTLRPGMFVTAELEAEVDSEGRVIKKEWAGKYVCPIHPTENPASEPGICSESKMPLRPPSAYGYADIKDPELPLVIPATAPLITGKRAIVYVEVPKVDEPTYELREVVLGPRAGDKYVVYKGLKEGEKVVSRGNFKIDSAMQIVGKPSMMRLPETKKAEEGPPPVEDELIEKINAPVAFLEQLTPAVKEYLTLKDALVEENTELAGNKAKDLDAALHGVKTDLLEPKAKESWNRLFQKMHKPIEKIAENKDVEIQRQAFEAISESFARTIMGFRHVMSQPLFLYHCPMASGEKGAYWIQDNQEIKNPYFGRKIFKGQDMFKCATLEETIPPEASAEKDQEKVPVDRQTEKAPASKPDVKDSANPQGGEGQTSQSNPGGAAK